MPDSLQTDYNLDHPASPLPLYIHITTIFSNHTCKNKSFVQYRNLEFTLSIDYC